MGPASQSSVLAGIVADLKREPSRTGSLIITFFGDAVVPRGGSVWLGTLLDFFVALDVDGNVVRTAMSRLAADNWFARTKIGRNSFYRLADKGHEIFDAAMHRVYDPAARDGLDILFVSGGGDAARQALKQAGFGSPQPGIWLAPSGAKAPAIAADAPRIPLPLDSADAMRLVAASWPLAQTADAYRRFIAIFASLEATAFSDTDALVARILLVTSYRRLMLRDPLLPTRLQPENWPGDEARKLCRDVYHGLLPASERWLNLHGRGETGPLPRARGLGDRFA